MDTEPNTNSFRVSVAESDSLPAATLQRQPLETQIPLALHTEPYDDIPTSPDTISNEPALWQLGRHSYYRSSTGFDPQPTNFSEQPVVGFTKGDSHGLGPGRAPHQLNKVDEAGLRDVEEELHRGLQARQVKMSSVLRAC